MREVLLSLSSWSSLFMLADCPQDDPSRVLFVDLWEIDFVVWFNVFKRSVVLSKAFL